MDDAERKSRHERLWRADHRHLWHPFTQMQDWLAEEPLIVDAAEGVHLVDTLGNRYLDGVSSLWCNVHGHRVPEIDAAIRAQLDRVAHSTLLGLASTASAHSMDAVEARPSSVECAIWSSWSRIARSISGTRCPWTLHHSEETPSR